MNTTELSKSDRSHRAQVTVRVVYLSKATAVLVIRRSVCRRCIANEGVVLRAGRGS